MYVDKQEQLGVPPISRHSEFAPQGDGTQGFVIIGCIVTSGAKLEFLFNKHQKIYF